MILNGYIADANNNIGGCKSMKSLKSEITQK